MKVILLVALSWCVFFDEGFAQASLKDSCIALGYFHLGGGAGIPSGNWNKKYGILPQVEAEGGYKTPKNWTITAKAGFIYTDKVKIRTQLFQDIDTFDGLLIDTNGELVFPDVTAQGWSGAIRVGKTFSSLLWKDPNPNSGIFCELGYEGIRHKLNIEVPSTLPIMRGEYLKGYDRLTFSQGVVLVLGYRFFHNKRLLNFLVFGEWGMFYSRNLRAFNYDTRLSDQGVTMDILTSLKVMWCLPLYRRAPENFYYY